MFWPADGASSRSIADPDRGIEPAGPSNRLLGITVGVGRGPVDSPFAFFSSASLAICSQELILPDST
jgi:hypothetical protein